MGGITMIMKYECLPCLVKQVLKVADLMKVGNEEKELLTRQVFSYLSTMDYQVTNPEVIGATFELIKQHMNQPDPYYEIRTYYNQLFMSMIKEFETRIEASNNPFEMAVKYAILGNIIDFNPIHNITEQDILKNFEQIDQREIVINQVGQLLQDIKTKTNLLYLGDNCGEICLDRLLIKKIKQYNPNLEITFAVRGEPVVNDSIKEDAYQVGIQSYATILSNGDNSLGTVLTRVSKEFLKVYQKAEIIISKGQANFESLSHEVEKNIYFMLVTKCEVIARELEVPVNSMICKQLHSSLDEAK